MRKAVAVKRSAVVGMATLLLSPVVLSSQTGLMTREEALASVYPGATVEAERVFLTSDQTSRASELARVDIESPLVARYVAREGGALSGGRTLTRTSFGRNPRVS